MSAPVRQHLPDLRSTTAPNPGPLTLDGTRTYLVGAEECVLVDPGPGGEELEERLRALVGSRRSVTAVCVTHAHPDHAGGARRAAEMLGAPVAGSREALERTGVEGRVLEDGDELPVDATESRIVALETPGHTRDHLCYLWIPRRFVFTGDLVLGEGSALVAHPDGRMGEYMASLARLLSLRLVRILPGHGPDVEEPDKRLERYRRHRRAREAQILEAVGSGARSVREIRERVYGPELPEELESAAEASVRAHLVHLEERGYDLPGVAGPEGAAGAG